MSPACPRTDNVLECWVLLVMEDNEPHIFTSENKLVASAAQDVLDHMKVVVTQAGSTSGHVLAHSWTKAGSV